MELDLVYYMDDPLEGVQIFSHGLIPSKVQCFINCGEEGRVTTLDGLIAKMSQYLIDLNI